MFTSGTAEISEWLKNESVRKREQQSLAVSYGVKTLFLTDYIILKKIFNLNNVKRKWRKTDTSNFLYEKKALDKKEPGLSLNSTKFWVFANYTL